MLQENQTSEMYKLWRQEYGSVSVQYDKSYRCSHFRFVYATDTIKLWQTHLNLLRPHACTQPGEFQWPVTIIICGIIYPLVVFLKLEE